MKHNTSLSEKRQFNGRYVEEDIDEYVYDEEAVKEFIKLLKEIDLIELAEEKIDRKESFNINHIFHNKIDKLAGKDLI